MRDLKHYLILLLSCVLAGSLLVACGDDDDDDDNEDMVDMIDDADDMTADADMEDDMVDPDMEDDMEEDVEPDIPVETGEIRVIHLSPDAPAVDVYANGSDTAAIPDLAFPTGTPYIELPAATYTFDVAPAGMTVDDSVLQVADFNLEADTKYTVAAIDEVNNITALPLTDDDSEIPAGSFRVRAIHAAPAVGQVDIWNVTDPENPAVLYEDVDFGVAGAAADLPAGQYDIGVDVDDDMVPDLTFELPELAEGLYVNLFAANDDSGAVFLNAQLPDGSTVRIDPTIPTSQLRVLHLSPDAPGVDVFVNQDTTASVTNLEYPDSTEYLSLPSDTYRFDVSVTGDPVGDAVLTADAVTLEEDLDYTVVAYDKVANISALVLEDDNSDPGADTIRVRAIHAAADVGQVDIWSIPVIGDPAEIYTDVDFGVAGAALDLPAGQYNLGIDTNNDADPELFFELPDLAAGTVANVFAVSEDASTIYLVAQFSDGTTARIDPAPARFSGLHLSPDTTGVDVFLDGDSTAVATNVTFPSGTGLLELEPGTHDFDIAPTGQGIGASVIGLQDVLLNSGEIWTGAAIGESTSTPVSLDVITLETNRFGVSNGRIRIRAIHAAPAVGEVDIWDVTNPGNEAELYSNVSFSDVGDYAELMPGMYTLGIDTDNDGTPELEFDTGMLPQGTVADIFAINDDQGDVSLLVHFADGTTAQITPNP